jgi:hypothetical protein
LVEFHVGDALHWGEAQAMVGRAVTHSPPYPPVQGEPPCP